MQTININQCLSLTDLNFSDNNLNIDYLAQKLFSNLDLEVKLSIATKCINLCEKFHSYFHFEESYFHLLLAKTLEYSSELYITELEKAIFQDPLNYEAKKLLLEILPDNDERLNDHRYGGDIKNEIYTRDYKNYNQFLRFAVGDTVITHLPPIESYWCKFNQYLEGQKIKFLQAVVESISCSHKLYHSEAAKLYYNRYLILQELNRDILAKNDLIKSRNLDSKIADSYQ